MTTTQPILLEQHGEYQAKLFKSVAGRIWTRFFDVADSSCDLVHWMVDGYSSTVRVTGRRIDENECSPEWETSQPIVAIVDGFLESMEAGEAVPNPTLLAEFREWVENGIMEAFATKRIEKKFADMELSKDGFVIVTSPTDAGLAEDELKVLWASDKKMTPAAIRARQKAAQKRKRHAVRKKKK
jgi:hypothetical protein